MIKRWIEKWKESRRLASMTTEGKRLNRTVGGDFGIFLFLCFVGAFSVLPMLYAVLQSLKPLDEIYVFPPRFWVRNPSFQNFRDLFLQVGNLFVPFSRYLFNTLFITITGMSGAIIVASCAAYPLAKNTFIGKKSINNLIRWTLLFVGGVTEIPRYIIIAKAGWIDTYWAILIPAWANQVNLFLMLSFMRQIPDERLDAAKIDGASDFATFWHIVLPSVKPALMTIIIFSFQSLWKTTGSNYIFSEELKMLPTALGQMWSGVLGRQGVGAAVTVFMMIPPIVMFIIMQSRVLQTMAHSGLKG